MSQRYKAEWMAAGILACGTLNGQQCSSNANERNVRGVVLDPSGASIEGARVSISGKPVASTRTNKKGAFHFDCIGGGVYSVHVEAKGFRAEEIKGTEDVLTVHLALGSLKQELTVNEGSDTANSLDEGHGSGTQVLTGKDLAGMADDPDDLKRQLQVLAASSGSAPGRAVITVDGFTNNSALPPKSSIASIRVAPDLYSSEYDSPPYQGGRVEVFTKPGSAAHGAVFGSESGSALNANDALTPQGSTPASKQDYGFELGGPFQAKKSDYFLALERRDTTEFGMVNAEVLNNAGFASPLQTVVAAPQRLWTATARTDWQIGSANTLAATYSLNETRAQNQGVGGLTLPAAGYDSSVQEQSVRLTDVTVYGPNLVGQTRAAVTWKSSADQPLSGAPSVDVAGAFIGGGSTLGRLNNREQDVEADEELSWTYKQHLFKFGVTSLGLCANDHNPNLFNGQYLYAGGATLGALGQYRLALAGTANMLPTSYFLTSGSPGFSYSQWQVAMYAQDEWKVSRRVSLSFGLRYALQTAPWSAGNVAPRFGLAWSPDRRERWVIRAHAGMFYTAVDPSVIAEAARLNGVTQVETQVYSPSLAAALLPGRGGVSVRTIRQMAAGIGQTPSVQMQIGIERQLPQHWHVQGNWSYAEGWGLLRSRNINAPLVDGTVQDPLMAPRPITPGENILQFQQSGTLRGPVGFFGIDQHSYKYVGIFAGYLFLDLKTDADTPMLLPQSSYSNAGEMARASWEPEHQVFVVGQITLPRKVSLDTQFSYTSGLPYNVVTGLDNNGDGTFNDRPAFVAQPGIGAYQTPFGLLSGNTADGKPGLGTLGRNAGTMPSPLHLDMNLNRTFSLPWRGLASDQHQTLNLHLQVANVLNHTNVTQVGSVLGSPTFAQPLTAEPARRIEVGFRYSF